MKGKSRKRKYVAKISGGITADMNKRLTILKYRTQKSKSQLVREGLELLNEKYREEGF